MHRALAGVLVGIGVLWSAPAPRAQEPPPPPTTAAAAPAPAPAAETPDAEPDTLRVRVTATVRTTPTSSAMTLGRQELEAAPARNAEELLRQVPGLTLTQHGSEGKGHQFFLRGFDAIHGADLELTLGGVGLNELSNIHAQGYIDLGVILPEAVESMRVTKGPFSIDQGLFGMAGSVDFKLGIRPEVVASRVRPHRVSTTLGTSGRLRLFARRSDPEGRRFAAAEALTDPGYGQQRGIDRLTFNAAARELALAGGTLEAWVATGAARFELPATLRLDDVNAGRIGFYDAYSASGRGSSARAIGAATWRGRNLRRSGDLLRVRLSASLRDLVLFENFTGALFDPLQGDRTRQAHRTFGGGADLFYLTPLTRRVSLVAGGHVGSEVLRQSEAPVDDALTPGAPTRRLDATQSIAGLRASLRLQPTPALRLDLGARQDALHFNTRDHLAPESPKASSPLLTAFSPRLSARYQPHDRWMLFATYGRGVRPPEARAFSSFEPEHESLASELAGNAPALTQSDAAELGVRFFATDWLGITLSAFGTHLDNEAVFDHLSGITLQLNATRRAGAEVFFDIHPTSWMHLSFDATYTHARFVGSGDQVPNVPWLVGGMHWVANHPAGWSAGLRFLGVSSRPLPFGATAGALTRFDATLGYRWRTLHLGLEVENLLHQRLREGTYHYASHWLPERPISRLPALHISAGPPLGARLTLSADF
ncbi:hypothetical protein DL240_18750 [Lujinxingia litoralis]|uniref:TonB-dependent receptor n=1 Tax=Lujinxingia litoralis TaxID=2211119 RepID=A0A328C446_9DELT|nr:TonB-dependent receptor [Lujinxingia litoralis]RAL20072.1 hypothetical protein DL240_18750 [Lujinxingia litoralis]